jgi:glycosyltransferase involved in cell wall biosynthesis
MSAAAISQNQESQRCSLAKQKVKRALIVNHAGLYYPSGMVRAMQYEPFFRNSSDWKATFTTRNSEILTKLFMDRRLPVRAARKFFRRPLARLNYVSQRRLEENILRHAVKCDIVSIIKSPGIQLYRHILKLKRPRLIADINDAVWMPHLYWPDVAETLSIVHGVICENEYIADYARRYNPCVFVIPDSPQIEVFDAFRARVQRDPQKITLGWIGGSQNLKPLLVILEALEPLFARYPQLHLRVVGADRSMLPKSKYLRYSCRPRFDQVEMVREVLSFDIGLFPLQRNDDGRARGTLKALVYMSGEAAVVAENFGENLRLIHDGINGMLARSIEEWHSKIEHLIENPEDRLALGKRGLETVRRDFTADNIFKKIVNAYDCLLSRT